MSPFTNREEYENWREERMKRWDPERTHYGRSDRDPQDAAEDDAPPRTFPTARLAATIIAFVLLIAGFKFSRKSSEQPVPKVGPAADSSASKAERVRDSASSPIEPTPWTQQLEFLKGKAPLSSAVFPAGEPEPPEFVINQGESKEFECRTLRKPTFLDLALLRPPSIADFNLVRNDLEQKGVGVSVAHISSEPVSLPVWVIDLIDIPGIEARFEGFTDERGERIATMTFPRPGFQLFFLGRRANCGKNEGVLRILTNANEDFLFAITGYLREDEIRYFFKKGAENERLNNRPDAPVLEKLCETPMRQKWWNSFQVTGRFDLEVPSNLSLEGTDIYGDKPIVFENEAKTVTFRLAMQRIKPGTSFNVFGPNLTPKALEACAPRTLDFKLRYSR